MAATTQKVVLTKKKECVHSVCFENKDPKAATSSIYVSRLVPGIEKATSVIVTIEPTALPA